MDERVDRLKRESDVRTEAVLTATGAFWRWTPVSRPRSGAVWGGPAAQDAGDTPELVSIDDRRRNRGALFAPIGGTGPAAGLGPFGDPVPAADAADADGSPTAPPARTDTAMADSGASPPSGSDPESDSDAPVAASASTPARLRRRPAKTVSWAAADEPDALAEAVRGLVFDPVSPDAPVAAPEAPGEDEDAPRAASPPAAWPPAVESEAKPAPLPFFTDAVPTVAWPMRGDDGFDWIGAVRSRWLARFEPGADEAGRAFSLKYRFEPPEA